MLNRFFIAFIVAASVWQSTAQHSDAFRLADLQWVTGTWKREIRAGMLYEKWVQVSSLTFEGESFIVSNGDTNYVEFLRLQQFGDEIFYVPKVPENKYPVAFKLVGKREGAFVFENPEHDFPQRILYRPVSETEMIARIEGTRNGELTGRDFHFQRE